MSLLARARRKGRDDGAERRDRHRAARERRGGHGSNALLAALAKTQDGTAPKAGVRTGRTDAPAATGVGGPADTRSPDAALIDPVAMLATIWRWRFIIAACTLAGALIGVLVALSTPHRYTAYSEVLIDPREIQLVGRDLEREFLANEAALAIVDSRLSLVRSRAVLERVIEATDLDQDPEFNGSAGRGIGLTDGFGVISSLFGDETPVETNDRTTLESLRDAIDIDRTSRTFVVTIGVEARAPRKAATLANEVTRVFVEEQASISAGKAISANSALTGRLDELQANVERAERRIEDFRIENGLVSAQGRLLSDDDLVSASDQLAEARGATIRARSKAEDAGTVTIDDAIAGSVPIDLNTPALTTFHAQHASLRQTAARLENQLGPRHPRLAAARAAIEAARQDIAAELGRIVQGAQSELRRAVRTEQELAARVARAKAAKTDQSEALVGLRDLQAEAEAARAIYSNALLRAGETGEIGALGAVNAAILSRAEPPLAASSVSRRTIAAAFTLAGLLVGLGLAVIAGLRNAVSFEALGGGGLRAAAPHHPDFDDPDPTRNPGRKTGATYPGYRYAPSPLASQPMPHPPAEAYRPQDGLYPPLPGASYAAPVPQAPHWQPPYPQEAPPTPAPAGELDMLRQSIDDIRAVVDALAARRDNVRRHSPASGRKTPV